MTEQPKHSKEWLRIDASIKTRNGYAEYHKEYMKKIRMQILEKLGNKCVRCGFSDPRALQIDHVHNDGNKERKSMNCCNWRYLKKVLADTEGNYQLLCANCNLIKKYEVF